MLSLLMLAASTSPCAIEHGRYQLRGDPSVTARFYTVPRSWEWPAGLALGINAHRTGRSYWFLPWNGGTDHATHAAWVREKRSPIQYQSIRYDLTLLTFDGAYNVGEAVPASRDRAPIHMLLPELTDMAWHSTTDSNRDFIARAFFDLKTCRAPERGEPAPLIEFPPIP